MIGAARLMAALACLAGALVAGAYAFTLSGGRSPLFPAARFAGICEARTGACAGDAARRAARASPLGAPALSQQLTAAYEAGAEDRLELARRVFRQDPRSLLARIMLAEDALSARDHARFLELYLPLFVTDRARAGAYAEILADLSADPGLYTRVTDIVQADRPPWGERYITALAGEGKVPLADLVSLYAEFPRAQAGLLGQMTRAGNWRGAYLLFNEFLESGALGSDPAVPPLTIPYNPALRQTGAPVPFNWQVQNNRAEWLEAGGVYAFYQGRRRETFLSQSFPLAPGRWHLVSRVSGEASETGGWFRWRISCAGGAMLYQSDLARLSAAPSDSIFELDHPAGACGFVTLTLTGEPGGFPRPARIEVSSVTLLPAGDGEGGP